MSLATEFLQDLKEGFANKDSSSVGGFVTDDFELISPVTSRPRQGFLDWVAEGGNPTTLFDVEVIYENDINRVWVYEVYKDEDAFKAHQQSPHYLKFRGMADEWRAETSAQGAGRGCTNIWPPDNEWS